MAGQLSALSKLSASSHLDLQLVGVGEIVGGETKAAGGNLLDGKQTSQCPYC